MGFWSFGDSWAPCYGQREETLAALGSFPSLGRVIMMSHAKFQSHCKGSGSLNKITLDEILGGYEEYDIRAVSMFVFSISG